MLYFYAMTLQTFREALNRRPFEPFQVVTSAGERYEVRHPEMAFLSRTALHIGAGPFDQGVPEYFRIVSLLHITAIEPLSSRAA